MGISTTNNNRQSLAAQSTVTGTTEFLKSKNGALYTSNSGLLQGIVYDYVAMTNPDANNNYQTHTYKTGGSGGTTVATLTYTYDASNNVTSITRS